MKYNGLWQCKWRVKGLEDKHIYKFISREYKDNLKQLKELEFEDYGDRLFFLIHAYADYQYF